MVGWGLQVTFKSLRETRMVTVAFLTGREAGGDEKVGKGRSSTGVDVTRSFLCLFLLPPYRGHPKVFTTNTDTGACPSSMARAASALKVKEEGRMGGGEDGSLASSSFANQACRAWAKIWRESVCARSRRTSKSMLLKLYPVAGRLSWWGKRSASRLRLDGREDGSEGGREGGR
jgi:hypothetical protein